MNDTIRRVRLCKSACFALLLLCLATAAKAQTEPSVYDGHPNYVTILPEKGIGEPIQRADTIFVPIVYKVNKWDLIPSSHLDSVVGEVNRLMSDPYIKLHHVWIGGSASPEGPLAWNKILGKNRAAQLQNYLMQNTPLTDTDFVVENLEEEWLMVIDVLKTINFPNKEFIIGVILTEPDRPTRKKKIIGLDGGKTWHKLVTEVFPPLRNARLSITAWPRGPEDALPGHPIERPVVQEDFPPCIPDTVYVTLEPQAQDPGTEVPSTANLDYLRMFVKTNLCTYLLAQWNLGIEAEITPQWSVLLHANHCGWDWFGWEKVKFRTGSLRAEGRYWLPAIKKINGFFVGAHFGFDYYNVAVNGDFRYQDKNGTTPAVGGGVDLGYRRAMAWGKRTKGHWFMEFALGAGAYGNVAYDKFYNVHNGAHYSVTTGQGYFGIDNVAATIAYAFDYRIWKKARK